jgi:rubrerythrin
MFKAKKLKELKNIDTIYYCSNCGIVLIDVDRITIKKDNIIIQVCPCCKSESKFVKKVK